MTTRIGSMLTEELLLELDKMWPDRCPLPKDPDLVIRCAERQVINTLWQRFKDASPSPDKDIL